MEMQTYRALREDGRGMKLYQKLVEKEKNNVPVAGTTWPPSFGFESKLIATWARHVDGGIGIRIDDAYNLPFYAAFVLYPPLDTMPTSSSPSVMEVKSAGAPCSATSYPQRFVVSVEYRHVTHHPWLRAWELEFVLKDEANPYVCITGHLPAVAFL